MSIVALVGRPNVGKSTLFNRLVGKKLAIVHDRPGVTRDRHYATVDAGTHRYTLIDTGGFDPESDDPMKQGIKHQIDIAIAEADVIVCVLEARGGTSAAEHAELDLLRRAEKPVIYVANKADSQRLEHESTDLYRLGLHDVLPISALHGRNIDRLEDALEAVLPKSSEEDTPEDDGAIRVAILGKPNAGKSSLVNRLAGESRQLVDDRPGTTRDPIDTVVERGGRTYRLIDTAGIRRKAKVRKERDLVEEASVISAIRSILRAEVVVLMADAEAGVAEQDAKILGLAEERARGIVIALNKSDLLSADEVKSAHELCRDKLSFAPWAPTVTVSAKTGRGVDKLLATIDSVAVSFRKRVPTAELNRFFERALETRPPPTHKGRAPRLYFITQAEAHPPLFVVSASHPEAIHFSYRRYVQNQLRKAFGFVGVPVRVRYKSKSGGRGKKR